MTHTQIIVGTHSVSKSLFLSSIKDGSFENCCSIIISVYIAAIAKEQYKRFGLMIFIMRLNEGGKINWKSKKQNYSETILKNIFNIPDNASPFT